MFDLKNATVLTRAQQKNVKGVENPAYAYATSDFGVVEGCTSSARIADTLSEGSYWCCNCTEAYAFCS